MLAQVKFEFVHTIEKQLKFHKVDTKVTKKGYQWLCNCKAKLNSVSQGNHEATDEQTKFSDVPTARCANTSDTV